VIKFFNILNEFFEEYELNKKISTFNNKFNYNLLKQGINFIKKILLATLTILQIDNCLCIQKVIWFYYKNSSITTIEHINRIFTSILHEIFFK